MAPRHPHQGDAARPAPIRRWSSPRRCTPRPRCAASRRTLARAAIEELEPFDRGFYTGIVGWCDANGDGEWAVTIRCAEAAGRALRLFAGAGVVGGLHARGGAGGDRAPSSARMLRRSGLGPGRREREPPPAPWRASLPDPPEFAERYRAAGLLARRDLRAAAARSRRRARPAHGRSSDRPAGRSAGPTPSSTPAPTGWPPGFSALGIGPGRPGRGAAAERRASSSRSSSRCSASARCRCSRCPRTGAQEIGYFCELTEAVALRHRRPARRLRLPRRCAARGGRGRRRLRHVHRRGRRRASSPRSTLPCADRAGALAGAERPSTWRSSSSPAAAPACPS